jgi:hypothetical protein
MSTGCCKCLGAVAQSEDYVRFWDGRDYCRSCLENTSPGLFDYVRETSVLKEVLPDWFNEGLPATAREAIYRLSSCKLSNVVPSHRLQEWEDNWDRLMSRHLNQPDFLEALFPPKAAPAVVRSTGAARSVEVAGGTVTVRQADTILHQAPLADWRWWDGEDLGRSWRKLRLPTYDMLVVVTRDYPSQITAAFSGRPLFVDSFGMAFCGFSPEMRARWMALFLLCGVCKAYGLDF